MALEQPVTDADVRALYRLILNREAENDAVVGAMVDAGPPVREALQSFLGSSEYRDQGIPAACDILWNAPDGGRVELDATPDQLAAMRAHVEAVWSAYGETETYWSVLTADQYRDAAIDPAALDEFYASGFETARAMERLLRRNGVDPARIGSVLDFGCGVARLAGPFGQMFGRYIGVDISAGHLRLAQERAAQAALAEAEFLDIRAFLASEDLSYDLYYSNIVLQHNPPPIMREMLRAGLTRVRPGGFALFQAPAIIFGYTFSVERYLAGEGRLDGMEMHALPQRAVFAELGAAGFTPLEVTPDPFIGPAGISYTYLAAKAC